MKSQHSATCDGTPCPRCHSCDKTTLHVTTCGKPDPNSRRWHWRTWNVLLQVQDATDGKDRRQLSGEMTERGLCLSGTQLLTFKKRGWVECVDTAEVFEDEKCRVLPVCVITPAGRFALERAKSEGIQIQ